MSPRKTLLLALGSILIVVFSGWITERHRVMSADDAIDGQLTAQPIGQPAPNFALRSVDGSHVRLSDYHGKPVIVAFWATWCGPCLFEMPTLVNFYREQKDNIALLAVSMDDTEEDARIYADHNRLPFPVLFDGKQRVASAYAVEGIPAVFVVDPDGTITAHHEGLISSLDTVLAAEVSASQRHSPIHDEK
jgi:peroxiredoxin